ncbi:hypothetical protein JCM16303_006544 [Sporobolomyces ruberrimus]
MPFNRFRTHSPESTTPRPRPRSSQTSSSDAEQLGQKLQETHLPPSRSSTQSTSTSTTSSTSDEPPSSRSSISRLPLSRLHAAVSRGASQSSTSSHSVRSLPEPETPIQLAELAFSTILTIPGPPLEELRNEIFPRLFHDAYSHRANTREHGLKELEQLIKRFRMRFESMRVRFKSHIMDQDGSATLQVAAVGLTYEIIAVPHHHHSKGEHRADVHERRAQVMAIVKIFEGKLAQTDIVLDTMPFQDEHSGPQLNQCTVM